MTKKITLPISKETCNKVKYGIGLGAGCIILGVLTYFMFALWYDFFEIGNSSQGMLIRVFGFFMFGMLDIVTIIAMLTSLKEKGIWLEIQCNCTDEKK